MQKKTAVLSISEYTKKGCVKGKSAEGKSFELRLAHPDEKVLVEILGRKNRAKLLEVLSPSPHRVKESCMHALYCGGCSLQSLDYKQQVNLKQDLLKKLYEHLLAPNDILALIFSENPWHYRNKMEFSFSEDKAGNKYVGLVMADSRGKVFNQTECFLTDSWFMKALEKIRSFWEQTAIKAYHHGKNEGTLETLTMREGVFTGEKLIMLTVSGSPLHSLTGQDLKDFQEAIFAALGRDNLSIFLQIVHRKKGVPTSFSEMHLYGKDHIKEKLTITYPSHEQQEFVFKISPSSFFQPNSRQAEKLFSAALAIVQNKKRKLILDLFCGTATLGILFSKMAEKVIGIEINPYAVFDGEVNIKENGIENIHLYKGDVAKVLPELAIKTVDLMILDPPRSGLGSACIQMALSCLPEEILYISCNPYTQVEDIKEFLKNGYELKALQGVDQFPHTAHLESIAYLHKKK